MTEQNESRDLRQYANDLATIKSLLLQVDEKPFIESWAMFSWGGLIIAGTVAHYLIHHYLNWPLGDTLLRLWLPIWLLASFLDMVAHVRWFARESVPFLSRPMVKSWLFGLGNTVGWTLVIFLFIKIDGMAYLPQLILIYFGTMFLVYAFISSITLNLFGFFLILSAVVLYIMGLSIDIQFLAAGIVLGFSYLCSGIIMRIKEREAHG